MWATTRTVIDRLLAIADEPGDDDDARLRKHVAVAAGIALVVAPLQLPILAQGHPLSWVIAISMPVVGITNLLVLARTRAFERYAHVLVLMVLLFPAAIEVLLGGIGGASAAVVFAFLGPVLALLALGPRRAVGWFAAFVAVVIAVVVLDPLVSSSIEPQPYPTRLVWYVANLLVPLGFTFALLRFTDIRRRVAEQRSNELLTNAIPASIATRLRRGEDRIAERYPDTTVLFADLAGFTPWARRTDPERVVGFLDDLFTRFDRQASSRGVEKIKTIGDAYMAVAGAPAPRTDHAVVVVDLGVALIAETEAACRRDGVPLELRVGIASGPVVGGVIGQRRILFDLWGDTVNTAARMQSAGVPGRVHLAPSTRDLIQDRYRLEPLDPIAVKGLGTMSTYLIADAAAEPDPPQSAGTSEPRAGTRG